MKNLVKNLGLIVILIGVAIIAIPQFMAISTNTIMMVGLIAVLIGAIAHTVINKRVV